MLRFTHYTLLTREGAIYIALIALLLVGALMRQINLLVGLYGMLAGPIMLSWGLSRRTLRQLSARRKLPESVPAGEPFTVTVEMKNLRTRLSSWAVVAQDRVQREGRGMSGWKPTMLLSHIRPGETQHETYRGQLTRRGRYRFGPLRVATRFPFGLMRTTTSLAVSDELVVTPRLGRLTRGWRQRLDQALESGGQGKQRRQARDGDFFGLREWRSDDSRRSIHWRSSARRQTLVVRQYEQSMRKEVTIVLDLWQPQRPSAVEEENVELAVSFAASLVGDLARGGGATIRVAIAGAEAVDLSGPVSPAFVASIQQSLGTVEATYEATFPPVFSKVLDTVRPGTALVVVTTRAHDWSRLCEAGSGDPSPVRSFWRDRMIVVDSSSNKLNEYFDVA